MQVHLVQILNNVTNDTHEMDCVQTVTGSDVTCNTSIAILFHLLWYVSTNSSSIVVL